MLRRVLTAVALFSALAVLLTWPVALRIGRGVPADLGDPLLNTWILWWNTRAVPLTDAWWNAPAFYPSFGVLAYSEHLLGLAIFTAPLAWLGASPLTVYSLALLASYVLAGVGAWALARSLTGRDDAAVLAGLAFAATPYRAAQVSHLQVLMAGWIPLALLGLHRFVETRRWPWLVLFAAAWLVQGLTNGYYLVFFGLLAALWVAWFGSRRSAWPAVPWIAGASMLVGAAVVPFLLEYRAVHEHYGFRRMPGEIAAFSADLLSLFDASPHLVLWGWLRVYHRAEGELFPGLGVVAVLAAVALARSHTSSRRIRVVRVILAVTLGIATAVLASYGIFGRWRADLLGTRVSLLNPQRPLLAAALAAIGLLATWPGIVDAWRRRSPLLFYAGSAAILFWLALGPVPTIGGTPLGMPTPYAWLQHVPGFSGLRVPARLWMLALACLSAAVALAWTRLPIAPDRRRIAAALAAGAIVADGVSAGIPIVEPPSPWPSIVGAASAIPILEVPGGAGRGGDMITMYRAITPERPVVAGYSGYFPPSSFVARRALTEGDASIASALAARGPADVLLDRVADRRGRWRRWLAAQPLRDPPRTEGRWTLYQLQPQPSAGPPLTRGPRLLPARVWASIHDNVMPYALDGRMDTSWFTVQQRPGETITIDLAASRPIGSVRLRHGATATDYSRGLAAERSDDGTQWTTMFEGSTAGLAWLGADEDPSTTPVTIALDGCAARFLRLRQTALDVHPWTIFELEVYEPGPDAPRCASGGVR